MQTGLTVTDAVRCPPSGTVEAARCRTVRALTLPTSALVIEGIPDAMPLVVRHGERKVNRGPGRNRAGELRRVLERERRVGGRLADEGESPRVAGRGNKKLTPTTTVIVATITGHHRWPTSPGMPASSGSARWRQRDAQWITIGLR